MTISVKPNKLEIGKTTTAEFTAKAGGINKRKFRYEWNKRDSNSLPDKVLGSNGTVLTIPNVAESDEGQYYCTVTNQWDRSVESNDVTLIIYGMYCLCIRTAI